MATRHQARDLLAAVYGWFTEGFDTPDLEGKNGDRVHEYFLGGFAGSEGKRIRDPTPLAPRQIERAVPQH